MSEMTGQADQESALLSLNAPIAEYRPLTAAERQDARAHPYIVVGNLALWLFENRDTVPDGVLQTLFERVEQLLASGVPAVRELIVVGLFEDLQNLGRNRGVADKVWTERLGPRSRAMWSLLRDTWARAVPPGELERALLRED